ncbi:hypothetical protein N0V85_004190 [Neurospora sp. IMI 360204]|nr:hypothetical protein N0V85_004190 [Neurospora sp. IMI 360204]
MSQNNNRNLLEQSTKQAAQYSPQSAANASTAHAIYASQWFTPEQVAQNTPEHAVQSGTTSLAIQNGAIENIVEVEEVVLPSIESPTENLPNDDDYATDPTGLAEPELRRRAVAWMEVAYRDLPNGTIVQPPSYFRRSRSSPAGRLAVWIKDFIWGHIRPRRLTNDRLANMPLARRERWARQQRREWEEVDEVDEEGESEEEGD